MDEIPAYTRDDYLTTTRPFEYLYAHKENKFEMKQLLGLMSAQAQTVGVRNLAALFKAYVETVSGTVTPGYNKTDFTGQEMELDCGGWSATDTGIYGTDKMGFEVVACYHPIMPVQRLVNIDTGIHKVKLAFSLGKRWNSVIEDRNVISDSRSIIGLSKYGVMVNSETSKPLVRYLADVEQLNYDMIPEVSSVGRLGWIDDYGFSPYVEDLVFDGEEEYRTRFESIQEKGSRKKWLDCVRSVRAGKTPGNVIARIVLAASFASVLVKPCNCLPFFVHLWGGTETGKAQPLDTKIITPTGWKLMGDIRVGDRVIGGDGKPKTVVGVYPQGEKEVYEVTFSDGRKTKCCKEHLWNVTTRTRRNHKRGYTVMSLEDMMKSPIKTNKGFTYQIPTCGPVEFEQSVPLPVDPYLLGALIGDGCLTMKKSPVNGGTVLYFNNSEFDVIGTVMNKLQARGSYLWYDKHSTNQFVIRNCKWLKAAITDLGLNVKSTERFIPEQYLLSDVFSRKSLMCGLIDTDGNVLKNGVVRYSTKSASLAMDVCRLAHSLGYKASVKTAGVNRQDEYNVSICANGDVFSSKKHKDKMRVADQSRNRTENVSAISIVSVNPVGEEECQCIMVDSQEHTYLCDDFIVTHNTVGLLLAASVWADPEVGKYIQTFNATEVGKELGAAFCNSMPLIIDELQLIKDNRKDFDRMIYQLSEGVGRARGRKQGGLQKTPTWRNCILTTGEFPIISPNSGAGAVNRTIEIDCHAEHLFDDPKQVATTLYSNYGFAGYEFVERLMEDGAQERVQELQESMQDALKTGDTMDKQTASAALILAADRLSEEWIFQDGILLQPDDIRPYLVSKDTVNQNGRALQFLYDFININQARFSPDADAHQGEVWGDLDDDYAYIIRSKFDQILQDEGFNASAFLGWAKSNGYIQCSNKGEPTKPKRINGRVSRCVWLKMSNFDNEFDEIDDYLLP